MRCPSWMPGGISTSSARSSSVRPAPEQASHGCSTIRPVPPQRAHGCAADELAERGPRHLLDAAGSAAVVAGRDRSAGLDAVAPALSAANRDLNGHFARDAGCRLFEVDLDLGRDVGSTRAPRPGRHTEDVVAEEGREDVGEAPEVEGRRAGTRRSAEPGVTEAVVQLPGLGLREHLVRLDDLLEALVRVRRIGDVRVQLAREPPECALDLGFGRRARDAEDLVVVATRRHRQSSSLRTRLRRSERARAQPRGPSGSPSRSPSAAARSG